MTIETKRDVFEYYLDLIKAIKDPLAAECVLEARKRYSAALPDDLPVIPKDVSEYIKKAKSPGKWGLLDVFWHLGDHISAMGFNGLYDWECWMVDNQDAVSRAWLDGVCIVEETGEIVKLEEEK